MSEDDPVLSELDIVKQQNLDLRKRNGDLMRAFQYIDNERCFLRKQVKSLRELARQIEQRSSATYEPTPSVTGE